jgi:hypothetical protein
MLGTVNRKFEMEWVYQAVSGSGTILGRSFGPTRRRPIYTSRSSTSTAGGPSTHFIQAPQFNPSFLVERT